MVDLPAKLFGLPNGIPICYENANRLFGLFQARHHTVNVCVIHDRMREYRVDSCSHGKRPRK